MAGQPSRLDIRATAATATQRALRWQFFAEVYSELRRAEWPSREQVVRLSIVVIILSAAIGIILGLVDLLLTLLINRLYLHV